MGYLRRHRYLTFGSLGIDNPWRYSNLGYQLLGLILQRASGVDYPALMTERLLAPLAMTHSGVGKRGDGTLLPGHADGGQSPQWDHPWGAGGVEATIADLARYARSCAFPRTRR
jgi:CubicO group peptidase (beta-lactamase class C family)